MLQISLLGPLEVRRGDQLLTVPTGKASELLVRLALEAGVVVSADRLLSELWADDIATRRNTLQSKVTMLRRGLGDPPVLVMRDGGYALTVDPADVDALALTGQAVTARELLEAGDHRAAADLCASTLRHFRGDLLPGAGDGDWAKPYRARFDQARLGLYETHCSARLQLGEAAEVVAELEAAVPAYPFRESLWELLIAALYRAGRQADALAAYHRVKDQLAEELGLDPGRQLQQLEQQILLQAASLGVPNSTEATAVTAALVGNLPSMSVELVGREPELLALADLVSRERLVELVGPGGVGKTAVAIAAGRRLAAANPLTTGGVWLARLETAVTADDVIDTVISALNAPGGEDALLERLRNASALLILDNCEHVVDAAASLAVRLLDAAPGLRILCTGQVALDIDGEAILELAPLDLSDAVELFTRRATGPATGAESVPTGDAVVDLCRSLDGLPLAIELAAARTKSLSIEEITRRLDHPFAVLSDPTSRRPERRRSLRSTIRWSYELLFPDDQRGLWALATFAGGGSLPAVEFVLAALDVPAAAAIDVVGRLASRSLVNVDAEGDAVRYRLLDSIRAFALEAMADAGQSERAMAAHAAWYADAAGRSTDGVRSSDQAGHLTFARVERANIDAALAWTATADPLLALHIVNGFGWAWVVLGDSRGTQRITSALSAAADVGRPRDRAVALLLAAWIEASSDRLEVAREHIGRASELADRLDDADLRARCLYYLAYVVSHHGEFRLAIELTDRSRALYDGLDRPWDQAANWLFAARAAISAGDLDRSADAAEHVQRWLLVVDDPWLQVRGEAMLGELARVQHRFGDAVLHMGRAAQTSRQLGFLQTEAYQVTSLGRAQCQAGDYRSGPATLQIAIEKAEATGDVRLAALGRVHLGRVLRATGQDPAARAALESAVTWHRQAGGGEQALLGECLLAALDAADQVADAGQRLETVLETARRQDDAPVEVFALDALARIATRAGDVAKAAELAAAADRRMPAASHFITELDRTDRRAGSGVGTPAARS